MNATAEARSPTLGETRVRLNFNPSANQDVESIKRLAAAFIDKVQELKSQGSASSEQQRLYALAQTHAEDAAMWAVKGATF